MRENAIASHRATRHSTSRWVNERGSNRWCGSCTLLSNRRFGTRLILRRPSLLILDDGKRGWQTKKAERRLSEDGCTECATSPEQTNALRCRLLIQFCPALARPRYHGGVPLGGRRTGDDGTLPSSYFTQYRRASHGLQKAGNGYQTLRKMWERMDPCDGAIRIPFPIPSSPTGGNPVVTCGGLGGERTKEGRKTETPDQGKKLKRKLLYQT
jgi:hypothetical protein